MYLKYITISWYSVSVQQNLTDGTSEKGDKEMLTTIFFKNGLMRKTAALLLSLVCCVGSLAGCGGESENDGETEKKYFVPSSIVTIMYSDISSTREFQWQKNNLDVYQDDVLTVCYEFDRKGNPTEGIQYNSDGSVSGRYEYRYDESGNLTDQIFYDSEGSVWRTGYLYDESGKLTVQTGYDSDGNVSWHYEYKYDLFGTLSERIDYISDDVVAVSTEYLYDENGNLTVQIGYDSDGNLYWRNEYKYDRNGNISECNVYDAEGTETNSISYEWIEATKAQHTFYEFMTNS